MSASGDTARAKARVRATVLTARGARADADTGVPALLAHLVAAVGRPRRAAVHRSWPGEPDSAAITAAWWGVPLLAPVLLPDDDLDWALVPGPPTTGPDGRLAWTDDEAGWRPGRRGTIEPAGRRLGRDAITGCDVVVVPALTVDHEGHRLGRGGGSYDRALARVGAGTLVVALLHQGELVEQVPAEPHDRPVDLVVTSAGAVAVGAYRDLSGGAGLRY